LIIFPAPTKPYRTLPEPVRRAFFKQVGLLANNLSHPSLHAKKYDESRDLWQARVSKGWRFYFHIVRGTYLIRDIVPHPK
jgi:mRNA interferase RelE/StbE